MQHDNDISNVLREKQNLLSAALAAERNHANVWLKQICRMRAQGLLPDYAIRLGIGGSNDRREYRKAQQVVIKILYGDDHAPFAAERKLHDCDRKTLIDALERERSHAIRWWSALNRMRVQGQLPQLEFSALVGSNIDAERRDAYLRSVNNVLFGVDLVRGAASKEVLRVCTTGAR